MTTIHSYTMDQNLLDAPHKKGDMRRARAASLSMVPTSTGAAKAVGLVLPELKGKLNGLAVRVPTPNVSVVDLVFNTERPITREAINDALIAAANGPMKGILAAVSAPLVSLDLNGNPHSSIVDLDLTQVIGSHMGKVNGRSMSQNGEVLSDEQGPFTCRSRCRQPARAGSGRLQCSDGERQDYRR